MAVKSELGDGGFEIWDTWSQQDDSYRPADARAVWRSIGPGGGITVATAPQAIAAGADVLVAGSATFSGGPGSYADNIRRLRGTA